MIKLSSSYSKLLNERVVMAITYEAERLALSESVITITRAVSTNTFLRDTDSY
jgi:hypothetical protein